MNELLLQSSYFPYVSGEVEGSGSGEEESRIKLETEAEVGHERKDRKCQREG